MTLVRIATRIRFVEPAQLAASHEVLEIQLRAVVAADREQQRVRLGAGGVRPFHPAGLVPMSVASAS